MYQQNVFLIYDSLLSRAYNKSTELYSVSKPFFNPTRFAASHFYLSIMETKNSPDVICFTRFSRSIVHERNCDEGGCDDDSTAGGDEKIRTLLDGWIRTSSPSFLSVFYCRTTLLQLLFPDPNFWR